MMVVMLYLCSKQTFHEPYFFVLHPMGLDKLFQHVSVGGWMLGKVPFCAPSVLIILSYKHLEKSLKRPRCKFSNYDEMVFRIHVMYVHSI